MVLLAVEFANEVQFFISYLFLGVLEVVAYYGLAKNNVYGEYYLLFGGGTCIFLGPWLF